LISALSRSMTSAGVLRRAPMPVTALASKFLSLPDFGEGRVGSYFLSQARHPRRKNPTLALPEVGEG
jgi:hypothetical protein